MKKNILLIIVFFLSFCVYAQKTEVFGRISDSESGEPVSYVKIIFKDTYIGTTSDLNGNYNLSSNKATSVVIFSALGYKSQVFTVNLNQSNKIDVYLEKEYINIEGVTVRPGENPAIALFHKIIDHKKENNPANFPSWRSRLYTKAEVDVKNFKESWRNKKLFSQFSFVFKYIDSLEIQGKTFLPVFFTETISDYTHNSETNSNHENIIANKASGTTTDMITEFTGKIFEGINPYENYIDIGDVGLISPLNGLGLEYYKYYLIDSAVVNNTMQYALSFTPRLTQEPVFKGKFWVEDKTYALTKLDIELSEKANINFLNNLRYSVEYQKTGDRWTPRTENLFADLEFRKKPGSDALGLMGRKTTIYENFTFETVTSQAALGKNVTTVEAGAISKDPVFWERERPIELQKREANIYQMVDSIKNVPLYKTVSEYLYMFYWGYRDLGKVELGPYYYFYSHNMVEGSRFRVGGRTTYKFNPHLRLNGYTAYGTKDKAFKYGGGIEYFFSIKPISMISLQGMHDYELLGKSSNAFMEDNILTTVLSKNPFTKLNMIDRVTGMISKEWFRGFSNQVSATSLKISSGPYVPFIDQQGNIVPYIRTGELKLNTRFAPGEHYVQNDFERTTLSNYKPELNFGITSGIKGFLGGNYNYLKTDLTITDKVSLSPFGFSYCLLQAGKIWGDVPFPLLKIHEGNETYAYDLYAFNLLNYHQYVSDVYAGFIAEHHFQGFFLNKIPLFKMLKWREIVGARAVIGSLDPDKHNQFLFPAGMGGLENKPYTELSVGLENIFKIIRVDAVWGKKYDDPAKAKLGLLFSLQIIL